MTSLQGYSLPQSPEGRSTLAPEPPWYYAGRFVAVEFWTSQSAVAAVLPPGLAPDDESGPRCTALFCEWQWSTRGGSEYLDPVRSQYAEFVMVVDVRYEGRAASYIPYMYVDSDQALARGWIQGLPKKLGSIRMTRAYPVNSPASPPLGAGAPFGASLAAGDRRLAEASVVLTGVAANPREYWDRPLICRRHFPQLATGRQQSPAVHELVQQIPAPDGNAESVGVWTGEGHIAFLPSPCDELSELTPLRQGRGWHGYQALSVAGSATVQDLARQGPPGQP
jgi:hypothetical protein